MELVINGLIVVVALVMLALGILPMFAPKKAVGRHYIDLIGPAGLNTMRSMIGGSFIANFFILTIGLVTGQTIFFLAVAVYMIVVAVGRTLGILIDGYHKAVIVPLVAEVIIALVLVTAHIQSGAIWF